MAFPIRYSQDCFAFSASPEDTACGKPSGPTGRQRGGCGQWDAPEFHFRRHVDFEANLRELAVLLPARRRHRAIRLDVCQPLALADDLFRDRRYVPGWRPGGITETA